jgi:hypothetical protein
VLLVSPTLSARTRLTTEVKKTHILLDIPKEIDMPMIIPTLIMILIPSFTSIFRPIYTKSLITIIFFRHFLTLGPTSSFRWEIKIKPFTLFTFFLFFP